jgi:hypothetical protein
MKPEYGSIPMSAREAVDEIPEEENKAWRDDIGTLRNAETSDDASSSNKSLFSSLTGGISNVHIKIMIVCLVVSVVCILEIKPADRDTETNLEVNAIFNSATSPAIFGESTSGVYPNFVFILADDLGWNSLICLSRHQRYRH